MVLTKKELKKINLVNTIGPRGILAGWALKKRYQIPLICTIEMLNPQKGTKNKFIYKFSRFLLTKAPIDKFICWSHFYQQQLINWGIPKKKITIIAPGLDIKKYQPQINGKKIKNRYSPNHPLIVFAKPLYSHHLKAIKLLIKTLTLLERKQKINLLIGQGPAKKQVKAYVKKLKVSSHLKFMPPVPFDQIPQYLAAADLIVIPFTYAPTVSRSLLEALAMGKPVITSNQGEIKYILQNNKQAILSENKPSILARNIINLLKNKKLAKKLSQNAVYLIREKFCLVRSIQMTMYCYQQVLKYD